MAGAYRLVRSPAVGEGGWEGVDDFGGLDGVVGDSLDHGDDVVASFFEPLVGGVDDAAGFVSFDVVAVGRILPIRECDQQLSDLEIRYA